MAEKQNLIYTTTQIAAGLKTIKPMSIGTSCLRSAASISAGRESLGSGGLLFTAPSRSLGIQEHFNRKELTSDQGKAELGRPLQEFGVPKWDLTL